MDYNNDKIIAQKVCKGEKNIEFENLVIDDIYSASKRLAKKYDELSQEKEAEHLTIDGYNIEISENIQNAAFWLWKKIKVLVCKYEGKAPLMNFIRASIYSSHTKIDYIRHVDGTSGNIPKPIKKLSSLHQSIYLMLRQNKNKAQIMSKLDIDEISYYVCYVEIEKELSRNGLIHHIIRNKKISLSSDYFNESDERKYVSESNFMIENSYDFEKEKKKLDSIFDILEDKDRRLLILYWGNKMKPGDIFNEFASNKSFSNYINDDSFKSPKDIAKKIDNLTYNLFSNWNSDREENVTKALFRRILKHYIIYLIEDIKN